jgi:hypothetical protein
MCLAFRSLMSDEMTLLDRRIHDRSSTRAHVRPPAVLVCGFRWRAQPDEQASSIGPVERPSLAVIRAARQVVIKNKLKGKRSSLGRRHALLFDASSR